MQSSPLPNVFPVWWECRIGHRTSLGFFIVIESIMSVDKITKTYNSIYKSISKSNKIHVYNTTIFINVFVMSITIKIAILVFF